VFYLLAMNEQEALQELAEVEEWAGGDIELVQVKEEGKSLKRKLNRSGDGYEEEALADLEQWREDKRNWEGETAEDREQNSPAVKRQYTEKDEQQTHKEQELIAHFKNRVEEFKLFLMRRLPPENVKAQQYYEKFFKTSDKEFAYELKTKLNGLSWIGGIDMLFTLMCNKIGMQLADFVDRSVDTSSWPEKKKDQLQFEILDYHSQLKDLVKLAKELPESFYFS